MLESAEWQRKGTPTLTQLAAAISTGAALAGHVPRRGRWRLPPSDPQLLHLQQLEKTRAQEEDMRVIHTFGPPVMKLKRALRDRCTAEHLDRLCS